MNRPRSTYVTEPHVRLSNSRRQKFPAADLIKLTMVQLLSACINEKPFYSEESNARLGFYWWVKHKLSKFGKATVTQELYEILSDMKFEATSYFCVAPS